MTKPISPEEVYEHARSIPPEVFEAFNECILRNFSLETGEAVFPKNEVVDLIKSKLGRGARIEGLLHMISGPYKDAGWKITATEPTSSRITFTRNRPLTPK